MIEGVVLPAVLALIMVGVGLRIRPRDFFLRSVRPRALLPGLVALLLLLPAGSLLVVHLLPGDPAFRSGLILLALSPVGLLAAPISNQHRGNVPLALLFTLASGVTYLAVAPAVVQLLWADRAGGAIRLPPHLVFGKMVAVTVLPIVLGWAIGALRPTAAAPLSRAIDRAARPALCGVLAWIIWRNRAVLFDSPATLLAAILLINLLAAVVARATGVLGRCDRGDTVSLASACIVRQEGAGLFIAVTLLGEPAAAIPLILNIVVSQCFCFAAIGRPPGVAQAVRAASPWAPRAAT
jgi:BASS family bile acid:Na+ symporter